MNQIQEYPFEWKYDLLKHHITFWIDKYNFVISFHRMLTMIHIQWGVLYYHRIWLIPYKLYELKLQFTFLTTELSQAGTYPYHGCNDFKVCFSLWLKIQIFSFARTVYIQFMTYSEWHFVHFFPIWYTLRPSNML